MGIENDLLFARQGTIVEEMVGWQDYNDSATFTSPIQMSVADNWYTLTNDGQGPYTRKDFRVLGKPDVYRPADNQFYLGDLFIGGIQILRTNFQIKAPSANTEVTIRMRMAMGSPIEYSIPVTQRYLKRSNFWYDMAPVTFFTIDNPETRDYPAEIQASADVGGCEARVVGWKMFTLDRY